MKITVIAFDSCMTSAVFGLLDAFNLASRLAQNSATWAQRIDLATVTGEAVRGFGGHLIQPNCSLAEARASDVVLIPAILGDLIATLTRERALIDWLTARRDTLLASACTGAFLLAEARVLDGRRITTNPLYAELFRARYPAVQLALDRRITEDGSIICAGATSAVLDLAIYIIDRLAGHDLAVKTAKALSMDKNPGSQRPYLLFVAPRDHGDVRVLQVQDWIEANHHKPLGLNEIATATGMSARNLGRRFEAGTGMSPMEYLRVVRIETAKRSLELQTGSVDQIATSVGYNDSRAFTRAFLARVGMTPACYRTKFRARGGSASR